MTLILSNDDVAQLLTVAQCMKAMELAYRELGAGRGVNRTRSDSLTPVVGRPDAVYGLKSMDDEQIPSTPEKYQCDGV